MKWGGGVYWNHCVRLCGWILSGGYLLNCLTFCNKTCLCIIMRQIVMQEKMFCCLQGQHQSMVPQWGAADTEIKVPSGENTEVKRYPFKAWSRSVNSHTCYAYCQEFLPCLFILFRSIHLHFFQNLSRFFPCLLWLTHGSCVGPQNKIGHPAGCRFPG